MIACCLEMQQLTVAVLTPKRRIENSIGEIKCISQRDSVWSQLFAKGVHTLRIQCTFNGHVSLKFWNSECGSRLAKLIDMSLLVTGVV